MLSNSWHEVCIGSRAPHCRNTRQDFLKMPSLWGPAMEIERKYFSNVILESNITPNIRSSDSFSRVPPIVNGVTGDALCVSWRLSYSWSSSSSISFPKRHITHYNPAKVADQGHCYCNSNSSYVSIPANTPLLVQYCSNNVSNLRLEWT